MLPTPSLDVNRETPATFAGDELDRIVDCFIAGSRFSTTCRLLRVEGFYSAGREKGRCPFPRAPFPDPTPESFESSLETRLPTEKHGHRLRSLCETTTRGHFYWGMTQFSISIDTRLIAW